MEVGSLRRYRFICVRPNERNRQVNYVICCRVVDFNVGRRERLTDFSEMRA